MTANIRYSSKVTHNNRRIKELGNRADALAFVTRAQSKLYQMQRSASGKAAASKLGEAASFLNRRTEKILIDIFGGGKVSTTSGGFNPDFVINEQLEEFKLVSVREDEAGQLGISKKVQIGGGEGIKLQRKGRQELITGFVTNQQGDAKATKQEFGVSRFVRSLIKNKNDSNAIYKILSGKGKAAGAIRASMTTKANFINIPVVVNTSRGKEVQNRRLVFSWRDIGKCVKKGTFKFTVIDNSENDFINFDGYFTASVIKKGLNAVDREQQRSLTSTRPGELGQIILELIEMLTALPSDPSNQLFLDFVQDFSFANEFSFLRTNSAKIVGGRMNIKRGKAKRGGQAFMSGADISAMIQQRLGKKMPKGPRRGPPLSPNFLTERTGEFRRSVRVIPNYRKSLIRFFYNPLYGVHVGTDRDPDVFVPQTIREVMLGLYKRNFRVVRGF